MHAVIRSYSGKGAKQLFDTLEANKSSVESLIRSVNGFVSYTLARAADGGISVTVCNDKAGCDESLKRAKAWIAENAASAGSAPPTVSEGTVILDIH
jgi:hypothetical protein